MDIIVACEQSQIITEALIKKGHNAMSCDLNYPGAKGLPHYQGDIFDIINNGWDAMICHPPCTYTSLSGNRWYYNSPLRIEGALFAKKLWQSKIPKIALEQPKTILGRFIGQRSQVIHPWQFGHGETKETWLWLKGFPPLIPTNIVEGRENRIWKMPPSPERQRLRSQTYQGIADAIADQWF